MLTSTVLECATDSTEGQLTRGAKISLSSGTAMLVSLASVEQYREPSTKVGRDRVALRLRRCVPVRVWGRPTNGLRLPTEIALFGCPISPSIRCSIRFARKSASGVCFGASVWPGKRFCGGDWQRLRHTAPMLLSCPTHPGQCLAPPALSRSRKLFSQDRQRQAILYPRFALQPQKVVFCTQKPSQPWVGPWTDILLALGKGDDSH